MQSSLAKLAYQKNVPRIILRQLVPYLLTKILFTISRPILHTTAHIKCLVPWFQIIEQRYAVLGLRQIFWRDVFQICHTCKLHTMFSNQAETDTIVVLCLHHAAALGYKNAVVRTHNKEIFMVFLSNAYAIKITVYLDTESEKD